MLRLPRSNYKRMPWANGRGVTAEIDRFPSGEGAYLWRLSQAAIPSDGPFSEFPGYDRWLAVWDGNAILLNERKIAPLHPVHFSGEEKIFCRLVNGPVRDLGLIYDRAKVRAELSVVEGPLRLPERGVHYLFDLETGDTLKFDHAAELSVARSLRTSVWEA